MFLSWSLSNFKDQTGSSQQITMISSIEKNNCKPTGSELGIVPQAHTVYRSSRRGAANQKTTSTQWSWIAITVSSC